MFNFDVDANTDDGDCEPYVFGCTDSIMFNYNPLANSDNSSCIPFISGCTDPSMLNYNPSANTEDFSCIAYMYGCIRALKSLWVAWIQTHITMNQLLMLTTLYLVCMTLIVLLVLESLIG